jgi:hypothetical protein
MAAVAVIERVRWRVLAPVLSVPGPSSITCAEVRCFVGRVL